MSSPKAPPPAPDPTQTINAANASNKATAVSNFNLNAVDQSTPFGSLKYTQTGTWPDGTPKYEANTSLTPELSGILNNQISRLGSTYGTPFDLNSSISTQLSDQATKLLDPIWKQRQAAFDTQEANKGITSGSEAYTNDSRDFADQRDRAYTSAALAGRSQAEGEALTQRNQPLSEFSSITQGTQPNFVNTPTSNIAPVDVAGITQAGYQNSLVPWNAQTQYNQALMGGLFGLGGAVLGGAGNVAGRGGMGNPFGVPIRSS